MTMTDSGPAARWIRGHSADAVDVLVYVVVLNLAIEYVPNVISETFTLSLLTALLLKVSLEVVLVLKGRILTRLRGADSPTTKVVWAGVLWSVAAGSKILVLEIVARVFSDQVSLGGFVSVTVLVVVLLLARGGVRWLLYGRDAR
jgi:hypothetical protein